MVDIDSRRIAFTGDNIWRPRTPDRPIVGPIISRNRYLPGVNHCRAARRLLDMDVNMIFPAHGEVFDVTGRDLEAHRDWADAVAASVRAICPRDLSGIDAWWCRIDPFHLYVTPGQTCSLKVVVDSPFAEPVRIRARLNLPAGFVADTMQDSVYVLPASADSVEFRLRVPPDWPADRRVPITVDLVINGELWPEQAEGLILPRAV